MSNPPGEREKERPQNGVTHAPALVTESLPQDFSVADAWNKLLDWSNRKARDAGKTNKMHAVVSKRRQIDRPPHLVCGCSG